MALPLLAKLFCAQYQLSTCVAEGWSVRRDLEIYHLSGADQRLSLRLNDHTADGRCLTERDGLLYLGNQMLVTPQTHWENWQARPARGKDRYYLQGPGGKPIPVTVGQRVGRLGNVLERDRQGHLRVGGRVILEIHKERELCLIVCDQADGEGYLSYFNVIGSGGKQDPRGTRGRFVRDDRGARFMELGGDNVWYDTARFYDPNGHYVEAAMRTLPEAERSAVVSHQLSALAKEARALGVEVHDLEEHDDLAAERESLTQAWKRQRFVVANGLEWIQEQTAGPQRELS